MEILIDGSNKCYKLVINYYYRYFGDIIENVYDTYDDFVSFMNECHPDISLSDLSGKYSKLLEVLTRKANNGVGDDRLLYTIHCFICGDILVSCDSFIGIREKMSDYFSGSVKASEGYLHTALAQNWSFDVLPGGKSFKINYWYDKDKKASVYKIHLFKDKVVFEQDDGKIHSMIVSDKYYIHYEGKKKGG